MASLEDVGKVPGGDALVPFLRVAHFDDGSLRGGGGGSGTLSQVLSSGNDAAGQPITNLADPTNTQDAATKNYVDSHAGGGSGNFGSIKKITANATAASTDYQILGDATSAGVTVTLPAASSVSGQNLHIHKIDTSTHNVNVAPAGSDTIEGVTGSYALRRQYASIRLVSDGVSNWYRADQPSPMFTGIIYVDGNNGNDSYSGTSPGLAKKTIQAAVTAIGNNSTLFILPGTYSETVDLGTKSGVRILGCQHGGSDSSAISNVNWIAPSATASCIMSSGTVQGCEIAYINFFGNGGGSTSTYTGTVFDGTTFTIGCRIHDIGINGGTFDQSHSKIRIAPGVYGGTGLHINNAEQCEYRNISIQNCNLGMLVEGTSTLSKLVLRNISFSQNFKTFREVAGDTAAGGLLYDTWKAQDNYALTFAIAILNSDGTNPADGDTITVRDQTYRFKNTIALANDVKIGTTYDATLLSLSKAVNQTGVVGTDYFTGTVAPTGMKAGKANLPENGGSMAFTLDSIDTTNKQMCFQLTDTVGPSGNGLTASTTSTHLSFGNLTGAVGFERAGWGCEMQYGGTKIELDLMENINFNGSGAGNCWLIGCNASEFIRCVAAPQTKVSLTGSYNTFHSFQTANLLTVQAGATQNKFDSPFGADGAPPGSRYVDNGTNTVWTNVQSTSSARPDVSAAVGPRSGYGFQPPSATGRYYVSPPGYTLSTFTPTVGRLYFYPLLIPEWSLQFGDVSINVTSGAASSKTYLGFYSSGAGGLPQTWDGNQFQNEAVATTGTGTASFGTFSLNRNGLIWLALGFLTAAPTVTGIASGTPAAPLVGSGTLSDMTGGGGQAYYIDSVLSGTFPYFSNITPANLLASSGAPAIFYKYA